MNAKGAIIDGEREIHLIYIIKGEIRKERSERRKEKGERRKKKGDLRSLMSQRRINLRVSEFCD